MSKSLYPIVMIEEEYGYRYWIWEPRKTREELIEWWRAVESTDAYLFSPASLPGKVTQIRKVRQKSCLWYCHLHMNRDSFLKTPEGEFIDHKGYVPIFPK